MEVDGVLLKAFFVMKNHLKGFDFNKISSVKVFSSIVMRFSGHSFDFVLNAISYDGSSFRCVCKLKFKTGGYLLLFDQKDIFRYFGDLLVIQVKDVAVAG